MPFLTPKWIGGRDLADGMVFELWLTSPLIMILLIDIEVIILDRRWGHHPATWINIRVDNFFFRLSHIPLVRLFVPQTCLWSDVAKNMPWQVRLWKFNVFLLHNLGLEQQLVDFIEWELVELVVRNSLWVNFKYGTDMFTFKYAQWSTLQKAKIAVPLEGIVGIT